MNVHIERDGCISCGLCTETCPEVFRMASDGLAEVYAPPTEDVMDRTREAAENCPVQVIKIDE